MTYNFAEMCIVVAYWTPHYGDPKLDLVGLGVWHSTW